MLLMNRNTLKKDIQMKWYSNNIPIRNNLLEPIAGVSKNIRTKKNAAVEALEGKQTHDIFEYFVNKEMKEMILKETIEMCLWITSPCFNSLWAT